MRKAQGLSIPKSMLDRIETYLDGYEYLSKSEFIRQAIQEKLERIEEKQ